MERVDEIVEQGAAIIDVGAYSTRPGAAFVDDREELSRLSFAVELIVSIILIFRYLLIRSGRVWQRKSAIASDRLL